MELEGKNESSVIKLVHGGHTRRLTIPSTDFTELQDIILRTWPITEFCCTYFDEDGDEVTVASTLELEEALRVAKGQKKILKLWITSEKKNEAEVAQNQEEEKVEADPVQVDEQVEVESGINSNTPPPSFASASMPQSTSSSSSSCSFSQSNGPNNNANNNNANNNNANNNANAHHNNMHFGQHNAMHFAQMLAQGIAQQTAQNYAQHMAQSYAMNGFQQPNSFAGNPTYTSSQSTPGGQQQQWQSSGFVPFGNGMGGFQTSVGSFPMWNGTNNNNNNNNDFNQSQSSSSSRSYGSSSSSSSNGVNVRTENGRVYVNNELVMTVPAGQPVNTATVNGVVYVNQIQVWPRSN